MKRREIGFFYLLTLTFTRKFLKVSCYSLDKSLEYFLTTI